MKINLTLFAMILIATQTVIAQQKRIRGIVRDSMTNVVLEDASISLYRLPDSSLQGQTTSSINGFTLRIPAGKYFIITSFIGYKNDTTSFQVLPTDNLVKLGFIEMVQERKSLTEVVIRGVIPPVTIKNDTLSFNASSFKTRPGATVEELLKKLPGVEVDTDGNISVQGRKVEKIYINGEEFFLNDPKLASQMLLANMIDKVEAFDNKSEFSKRTGIPDDTNSKAINLKLKPGIRIPLFGGINAGYSSGEKYRAFVSLTGIKKKTFWSFDINSNNSGISDSKSLNNVSKKAGTTQYNSLGFNYSTIWKKFKLGSEFKSSSDKNNIETISNRETFTGDSSLLQKNESKRTAKQNSNQLNVNVIYIINTLSTLALTGKAGVQYAENNSINLQSTMVQKSAAYLLNEGTNTNIAKTSSWSSNYIVTYGQLFRRKGRYFQAVFSNVFSGNDTKSTLLSVTKFTGSVLSRNQRIVQHGGRNHYSFNLLYTEPVGKAKLDFGYTLSLQKNINKSTADSYDTLTGQYNIPDSLAINSFRNTNQVQAWSASYNYLKNKIRYQAGMGFQQSRQNNNNVTAMKVLRQTFTSINPRASFEYAVSKNKKLMVQYRGYSQNPSIEQLQPLPDYSNPLFIKTGNPDLKPSFSHSIEAMYTFIDPQKLKNLSFEVFGNTSANGIVNSIVLNSQGIQQQQFVNVNGTYQLRTSVNYSFPLGDIQFGKVTVNTTLNYGHNISLLNGVRNTNVSFSWKQDARVSFNIKNMFFAELSEGTYIGKTRYVVPTSFFNQNYAVDISYVFPFKLTLATFLSCDVIGPQGSLAGQTITIWNASMSKKLFQNKRGEIRFSAFDMLNNDKGFLLSTGDNYIQTLQSNVLPNLFLLSFSYRFTK